jgi:3-hydroxyacyl-CoA dehydrogenase
MVNACNIWGITMVMKIRKTAVIGAGVMGGGIAALLAGAGIKTLFMDIVPADFDPKKKSDYEERNKKIHTGFEAVLKSKPPLLMERKDAELITLGNLEDDFEKLAECDWIIEAVVEKLDVKQDLFQRIENVRKSDAIVSTNTSGLPLRILSEKLSKEFKKHFLGTHFFNPVRYMRLLEIIPGEETAHEVVEFMCDFGERFLGKGVVLAKDTPNFIGNRIGIQQIVLAMQVMQDQGLSVSEVDSLFGPVIGRPKTAIFRTCDLVGMDTLAYVAKNTYELVNNDEQKHTFKLPGFIDKMIEKNLLGNKTGSGFYRSKIIDGKQLLEVIELNQFTYNKVKESEFECLTKARNAETLAEKIRTVVYGKDEGARFAWKAVAASLIYAASRIPEIADSIVEIDNAMKWGFNFQLGPFETWDVIGVEESVDKMEEDGFYVPYKVKKMLWEGNSSFYKIKNGKKFFYDFVTNNYKEQKINRSIISLPVLKAANNIMKTCKSASLVNLGDNVFCCEFHTKMNVINNEIIDFLEESLEFTDRNGVGMVIGNQEAGVSRAFSVGGDLNLMGAMAKQGKYYELEQFIKSAQKVMQKSRYAAFPVVAAPYGLTLGGGCEICLGAADKMLVHAELYMGLVEMGVGLLPAGGGCLNLWKKFLRHIPDPVQDLDLAKFFTPVFRNIVMPKVSSSAANARSMGFLGPEDRIVFNLEYLIGETKKEVLRMVDAGYLPPVKRPVKVFGDAAQGIIHMELKSMVLAGYISEYDAFLGKRIGYVLSGGDISVNSEIDEEVILKLEREAFVDFWKEPKTQARVEHMLKTGKPLRN